MELDVKVAARTFETETTINDEDLFVLGGKMAGVCYMPEDYFDGKIQDEEKAIIRANNTCNSGHHSVFDHGNITFRISGIPKIMAMLLNSTEQYTTSEKSARYTVMKPETDIELEVYNKWRDKFEDIIEKTYPNIDEKTRKKLALENARYLISVFTPTHMMWTTSYRQISYIIEWLDKLSIKTSKMDGEFNRKISDWCAKLRDAFKTQTKGYTHIHDNKSREFEFMQFQRIQTANDAKEYIGDVYQIQYLASFAQLAQEHRHRTIHYEFEFKGIDANEYGVYMPPILIRSGFEDEWKSDFSKIAFCYPQGTLVKVTEQGRTIKFFEKCKERLCGRAQLETMTTCRQNLDKFIANRDKLSKETQLELNKIAPESVSVTKCCMSGVNCTEHCMWGPTKAFERLI